MRLAILSDVHGNPLAQDAVLADIQRQGGVDAYWVLGGFRRAGLRSGDPAGNPYPSLRPASPAAIPIAMW